MKVNSYQLVKFGSELLKYYEKKRDWVPNVKWYYGSTGTGKTKAAYDEYNGKDFWRSSKNLKWWEGYDAHENVLIDEFRADFCTFHELLEILDRYDYRVECKGGSRQLLAKNIIITSNKHPKDIFEHRCEEDIEQLMRRISSVKCFGTDELDELDGEDDVYKHQDINESSIVDSDVEIETDVDGVSDNESEVISNCSVDIDTDEEVASGYKQKEMRERRKKKRVKVEYENDGWSVSEYAVPIVNAYEEIDEFYVNVEEINF